MGTKTEGSTQRRSRILLYRATEGYQYCRQCEVLGYRDWDYQV